MACIHLTKENCIQSLEKQLIYKDQCTKCFADPTTEVISLCLKCLNGGCVKHAHLHYSQTKHPLVLNLRYEVDDSKMEIEEQQITKLAIGKPGGAQLDNTKKYKTLYTLQCLECNKEIDSTQIKDFINQIVESKSSFYQQSLASWEAETLPCEHTLILEQCEPFKLQDKTLQQCYKCELTTNLWLCLSCGNIGCGRKFFDGTGGNKHALDHKRDTQHPLVVKLGTITPEGTGSCYCYRCDTEVKNEYLASHLINFGINVINQKKTEQTVEEMNLEANLKFSLSKLIEEGQQLELLYGSGYTGLKNIGSTCYMNSIVQALFQIQEIKEKYYIHGQQHLEKCSRFAPNCFICQVSKLAHGLESGLYSQKQEIHNKIIEDKKMAEEVEYGQNGINLQDLKSLVGKSNSQFASLSQQDAEEFLQAFLSCLEKSEKLDNQQITNHLFEFDQTQLLKCKKCNSYKTTDAKGLRMKVNPPYQAVGKDDKEYDIDMTTLIHQQAFDAHFNCPYCNSIQFTITEYMKNFPKYLIISVNRFEIDNFLPTKIQAYLKNVEEIDVQNWKFQEPPKEWKPFPSDHDDEEAKINQENLQQLMQMGYNKNRAARALLQTNNNLEQALNTIFETIDDPKYDQPLRKNSKRKTLIDQIMIMGFNEQQAQIALQKNNNDIALAIEYIFNNPDEIEKELKKKEVVNDSQSTKYELQSAVIHLGTSIKCGHYVCYAKKNNDWIYYNDEKVAKSKNPLLGKASLLIYKNKI